MLHSIISSITECEFTKIQPKCKKIIKINISDVWTELSKLDVPTQELPALKFNVEEYMNALPYKYLIGYIVASLFNVFHNDKNEWYLYDDRSKIDTDTLYIIKRIKDLLKNYTFYNYYIRVNSTIGDVDLPWNDYIIANLAYICRMNDKITQPTLSTDNDIQFEIPCKINDNLEYSELYDKVYSLLTIDPDYIDHILDRNRTHDHFLNKTITAAVCINGTACTGKSTVLRTLVEETRNKYDKNSFLMKAGKLGGFRGKDQNQCLSLAYQLTTYHAAIKYPTAIMDRCPFNNLIWRCILSFMEPIDNIEHQCRLITQMVYESISKNTIQVMKDFPVIILIDLNILANRSRMYQRATGGDRYRCFIQNYVLMQNLFYCLFADYANWPVFNTPISSENQNTTKSEINQLALRKVHQNYKTSSTIKMPLTLEFNAKFKSDYVEDLNSSKRFNILK